MRRLTAAAAVALAVNIASAASWHGLSDADHCAGPKITAKDLAGKVVLVDRWGINCGPCRALLPRMEQIWKSFRNKGFVLVGSHCQDRDNAEIAKLVKANKLTYPIYQGFDLDDPPESDGGIPFLYVVNHRGKAVYSGRDERAATKAIVEAVMNLGAPPSLCGDLELGKGYKGLEKQLVLGKPVKAIVKKLEADVKRGQSKLAKQSDREQAEEAAAILDSIKVAKDDVKSEIDETKENDPPKALKLVKEFIVSFPDEAAPYKAELPELQKKAKAYEAEQKAKAKASAKK